MLSSWCKFLSHLQRYSRRHRRSQVRSSPRCQQRCQRSLMPASGGTSSLIGGTKTGDIPQNTTCTPGMKTHTQFIYILQNIASRILRVHFDFKIHELTSRNNDPQIHNMQLCGQLRISWGLWRDDWTTYSLDSHCFVIYCHQKCAIPSPAAQNPAQLTHKQHSCLHIKQDTSCQRHYELHHHSY